LKKSASRKLFGKQHTGTDFVWIILAPLFQQTLDIVAGSGKKLWGHEVPRAAQFISGVVAYGEMTRIASHPYGLGQRRAIDMGRVSVLLYCFRG